MDGSQKVWHRHQEAQEGEYLALGEKPQEEEEDEY